MRGENGKESLINGRASNCPGKRLNVPDSRDLIFKRIFLGGPAYSNRKTKCRN